MHSTVSILLRLAVVGMLVFNSASVVLGQDNVDALRREWGPFSKREVEFEISDAALLPSTLARVAEQSGCRDYKEGIKDSPVRFIRSRGRRFAIVFCPAVVSGSHQVFDIQNVLKPTLVQLPFLAIPSGFSATARPGWITWEKGADAFHAETGSDISPARIRHTYHVDRDTSNIVVVRVEFTPHGGIKEGWTTIWDAPIWSFPGMPN
jgi:hypothetical protein